MARRARQGGPPPLLVLAQRPTKTDVETSRWRYSLMNWGHDPLADE